MIFSLFWCFEEESAEVTDSIENIGIYEMISLFSTQKSAIAGVWISKALGAWGSRGGGGPVQRRERSRGRGRVRA